MKTVLMVTNSFPPGGGSGMLRTMKFTQYLPLNGWRPVVLSVKEKYNDKKDFSVLKNIPALVKVYRTDVLDFLGLFNTCNKKTGAGNKDTAREENLEGVLLNKNPMKDAVKGLKRGFLAFFSTPDKFIGWLLPAVMKGLVILHRERIDIIYSTSPPATTTLIGLVLKEMTGKKFVVDFRDPWALDRANNPQVGRIRLRVERWLEYLVFRRADTVIVNTEYLKRLYAEKFAFKKEKIIVIPNGYDSEDFDALDANPAGIDNEKLTISHVGEFYENDREPVQFLNALAELFKDGRVEREKVRVNFVGGGEYVDTGHFLELMKKLDLNSVVRLFPRLAHRESIQCMTSSHALLLLQPTPRYRAQIPAKAFEYLKTGRFIFAVAPEGATADLIQRFEAGVVVDAQDAKALKERIFELYDKFTRKQLRQSYLNEAVLAQFERKALTENLSGVFDAVLKHIS